MDIRKTLALNMRRIRLGAGLSQEAVAERMGVDRAYVSGMERALQNVTILTLWYAAEALGCRSTDLLDEESATRAVAPKGKAPRRKRTKQGL